MTKPAKKDDRPEAESSPRKRTPMQGTTDIRPAEQPQDLEKDRGLSLAKMDEDDLQEVVLAHWQERPFAVFSDFCGCTVVTMECVAVTHWAAKKEYSDEVSIVGLCPNIDRFHAYLALGKAIWDSGVLNRYLTRTEVVRVNRFGKAHSRYDGSCYHDVALRLGADLRSALEAATSSKDFCDLLRFQTAQGELVTDYLQSLTADIRCESQAGLDRWQSEQKAGSNPPIHAVDNQVPQGMPDPAQLGSTLVFTSGENGPLGLDSFQWDGITHRGLTPKGFRLISALWAAKHRTLDKSDAEAEVYGHDELAPENGMASLRRELNTFLRPHIPFRVKISSGKIGLQDHLW